MFLLIKKQIIDNLNLKMTGFYENGPPLPSGLFLLCGWLACVLIAAGAWVKTNAGPDWQGHMQAFAPLPLSPDLAPFRLASSSLADGQAGLA